MAQGGKQFYIEPLNGNNYYNWKFRIEMILAENNVLEYVKNEMCLDAITDENQKASKQQKDAKAKSLIVQCVHDSQLEFLRDKSTAFKMWRTLQERYEKKGLPGQLYLKKKLFSLKMKEDDSLEKFIFDFEEIVRQLKAAGTEISDEDLMCNILLAMPKSYETMVSIIENMKDINYEVVKNKLLAEDDKHKMCREENSTEKPYALVAHKDACFKCGEVGHYKRDCKKYSEKSYHQGGSSSGLSRGSWRGRGQRGKSWIRRGMHRNNQERNEGYRSNFAEKDDDKREDEKNICFMGETEEGNHQVRNHVNVPNNKNMHVKFFIDSGCTDHMVNENSYFTSYMTLKKPINILQLQKIKIFYWP